MNIWLLCDVFVLLLGRWFFFASYRSFIPCTILFVMNLCGMVFTATQNMYTGFNHFQVFFLYLMFSVVFSTFFPDILPNQIKSLSNWIVRFSFGKICFFFFIHTDNLMAICWLLKRFGAKDGSKEQAKCTIASIAINLTKMKHRWNEESFQANTIRLKFIFRQSINDRKNSTNALILWLNDVFNSKTWFACFTQATFALDSHRFFFLFLSFILLGFFMFSLSWLFVLLKTLGHGWCAQWYTIFGVSFFGKIIAISWQSHRAKNQC